MEVTILDATNVPTKAVLEINTGSIRGQARLQVNQSLFVASPCSISAVEIALFQQLATQRVVDDEPYCSIPFQRADGINSQVQLQVRRQQKDSKGTIGFPRRQGMGSTSIHYLEKHKLKEKFEDLIQDVLREQPDDPYKCMLEALKKARSASGPSNTRVVKDASNSRASKHAGSGSASEQQEEGGDACSKTDPCDVPPATSPHHSLIPRPPKGPAPARKGRSLLGMHIATERSECGTGCPRAQAVSMARIVITTIMHSPSVQRAAQGAAHETVHKELAHGLAAQILTSARTQAKVETNDVDDVGLLARAAIRGVLRRCSIHSQALAHFVVRMSLKGAACRMASQENLQIANVRSVEDVQRFFPAPIVSSGVEQGWGQWLTHQSK